MLLLWRIGGEGKRSKGVCLHKFTPTCPKLCPQNNHLSCSTQRICKQTHLQNCFFFFFNGRVKGEKKWKLKQWLVAFQLCFKNIRYFYWREDSHKFSPTSDFCALLTRYSQSSLFHVCKLTYLLNFPCNSQINTYDTFEVIHRYVLSSENFESPIVHVPSQDRTRQHSIFLFQPSYCIQVSFLQSVEYQISLWFFVFVFVGDFAI